MKYLFAAIVAALTVGGVAAGTEPEASVFPKTLPFPEVRTLAGDGQPGAADGSPGRVNRPCDVFRQVAEIGRLGLAPCLVLIDWNLLDDHRSAPWLANWSMYA